MEDHMISKEHLFYSFSSNNKPVYHAESGETLVIETVDAFGGQLQSEDDSLDALDWSNVNPATGPIYVKDAMPGDFLKVTINSIELNNKGVMASIPDAGVFGHLYEHSITKFFDIHDNYTEFNDMVIPLTPMIGVIGLAPEGDAISNGEPGAHGGNMDNRLMSIGTELFLPVFHEGALFGLGDLHASMGDGEVNVTGIEIGGKVTVTLEVVKGQSNGHPIFVKDGFFYCLYSSETLDEAANEAAHEMHYWVRKALSYSDSDAAMLISLMGHIEICQIVDPKKTVRLKMPYRYFRTLSFLE
jgi:amidase